MARVTEVGFVVGSRGRFASVRITQSDMIVLVRTRLHHQTNAPITVHLGSEDQLTLAINRAQQWRRVA